MIEGVKHLIISYLNPKNLLSNPYISSTHIELGENAPETMKLTFYDNSTSDGDISMIHLPIHVGNFVL